MSTTNHCHYSSLGFALGYPDSPSTSSNSTHDSSVTNLPPSYHSDSPPSSSYSHELLAKPHPFYFGDLEPPPYQHSSECGGKSSHTASAKLNIPHPYARLYAKKEGSKRRKIWNHALEKSLFSPNELCTMGAPHRRTIYIASLEAHVDRLHAQMISLGFFPVDYEKLEPFRGLNSKTAKSMVSGLQHDMSHTRLKLLELERANGNLRKMLAALQPIQNRRHLAGSSWYGYDH